jgi:hypothetical protein
MTEQRRKWGWRTWQRIEPEQRAIYWAEHELGEEPWTAAYGFVEREGVLTLAEMRIFPTRDAGTERSANITERVDRLHLGEWGREPDVVPRGGLPTRTIRLARPGEALAEAFTYVARQNTPHSVNVSPHIVRADAKAKRPAKPRRDPLLLARVAVLYEQAMVDGVRPNVHIHDELKHSPHQVSPRTVAGLVRAARAAGYLTPSGQRGSASGRATKTAHELLKPSTTAAVRDGE